MLRICVGFLLVVMLGIVGWAQQAGDAPPAQEPEESGPKETPPPPYDTYEAALEPLAKASGLSVDQVKQLLDRFCVLASDEKVKEWEEGSDDSAKALAELEKKQRHIASQPREEAGHYRSQAALFKTNQKAWEGRLGELQKDFDEGSDAAKKAEYLAYWRGLAHGYWTRFYDSLAHGEVAAILATAAQWAAAEPEWTRKAVAKAEIATRLTYFRRVKQPNGRYKNIMQSGFGMQSDGYEQVAADAAAWKDVNNLDRMLMIGDAYFKIATLMKMAAAWAPKGKTAKDVLEQLCRYEAPQLEVRFKL